MVIATYSNKCAMPVGSEVTNGRFTPRERICPRPGTDHDAGSRSAWHHVAVAVIRPQGHTSPTPGRPERPW
jgi:hypothetical protein